MITTSFQGPSVLALALLAAGATQSGPLEQRDRPAAQALERGTRLDLVLATGVEHRFRVRRNDPQAEPADVQEPTGGAVRSAELALALEHPAGGRQRVVTVRVRPDRGRSVVYYALVDERAAILRLRRQRVAPGAERDEPEAHPALDEALVRLVVELALGSGLHGPRLEKGELYPLGATDERESGVREAAWSPPASERAVADELALQFQGIGVGGASQVARFHLVLPATAPEHGATSPGVQRREGRAPAGQVVGVPAGDASYSLADGLLASLSYRPGPASLGTETDPRTLAWLELERVED